MQKILAFTGSILMLLTASLSLSACDGCGGKASSFEILGLYEYEKTFHVWEGKLVENNPEVFPPRILVLPTEVLFLQCDGDFRYEYVLADKSLVFSQEIPFMTYTQLETGLCYSFDKIGIDNDVLILKMESSFGELIVFFHRKQAASKEPMGRFLFHQFTVTDAQGDITFHTKALTGSRFWRNGNYL